VTAASARRRPNERRAALRTIPKVVPVPRSTLVSVALSRALDFVGVECVSVAPTADLTRSSIFFSPRALVALAGGGKRG